MPRSTASRTNRRMVSSTQWRDFWSLRSIWRSETGMERLAKRIGRVRIAAKSAGCILPHKTSRQPEPASAAISRRISCSAGPMTGVPASISPTPAEMRARARRSFSSREKATPGACSPSRRVVSTSRGGVRGFHKGATPAFEQEACQRSFPASPLREPAGPVCFATSAGRLLVFARGCRERCRAAAGCRSPPVRRAAAGACPWPKGGAGSLRTALARDLLGWTGSAEG